MKLLFCETCWDVFKLDEGNPRSCKCGEVTGHYVDRSRAVTNGKGISIAIGNGSLMQAIVKMHEIHADSKNKAGRGVYLYQSNIHFAWVRPNEGPGNPRTTIE